MRDRGAVVRCVLRRSLRWPAFDLSSEVWAGDEMAKLRVSTVMSDRPRVAT